jgi:hypothetical protein
MVKGSDQLLISIKKFTSINFFCLSLYDGSEPAFLQTPFSKVKFLRLQGENSIKTVYIFEYI